MNSIEIVVTAAQWYCHGSIWPSNGTLWKMRLIVIPHQEDPLKKSCSIFPLFDDVLSQSIWRFFFTENVGHFQGKGNHHYNEGTGRIIFAAWLLQTLTKIFHELWFRLYHYPTMCISLLKHIVFMTIMSLEAQSGIWKK